MAKAKTRNISNENLKEIYDFIENFQVRNEIDERNLIILKYAYINNLSATSIAKLNNPKLISYGNHNNGNNLSDVQIRRIIASYNLEKEKRIDYSKRNNYRKRNEGILKAKKDIKRPHICACCGETKNLELHHIFPLSMGGTNDYFNLAYLCHECHYQMHQMLKRNNERYSESCKNNRQNLI